MSTKEYQHEQRSTTNLGKYPELPTEAASTVSQKADPAGQLSWAMVARKTSCWKKALKMLVGPPSQSAFRRKGLLQKPDERAGGERLGTILSLMRIYPNFSTIWNIAWLPDCRRTPTGGEHCLLGWSLAWHFATWLLASTFQRVNKRVLNNHWDCLDTDHTWSCMKPDTASPTCFWNGLCGLWISYH